MSVMASRLHWGIELDKIQAAWNGLRIGISAEFPAGASGVLAEAILKAHDFVQLKGAIEALEVAGYPLTGLDFSVTPCLRETTFDRTSDDGPADVRSYESTLDSASLCLVFG